MLAFFYFLGVEYRQSSKEAKHDVLVAAQSIALEHNAQVEGIRNLLITLSQYSEIQRMDPIACSKILNHILEQSPSSLNIGVADPLGNVIATGVKQPLPIRYKISDRKYFQDAVRTKRFSSGEYTISRAVGKPTLHFALPILDSNNNPQVVLYAALDLTRFNSLLEAQNLPPKAAITLTDHKGIVLYRYPSTAAVKNGQPDSPTLWHRITGEQENGVFVDFSRDGSKRVFGFKRLRFHANDPPYLYIRVSVPNDAVIAYTKKLVSAFFVIFLGAVTLTYACTRFLANRSFIQPIEQLSATSKAVENGDLSARSGLTHLDDEIGQLAMSFDAMTASLTARLRERDDALKSLKASKDQLHAIYDHMNDAILIHDITDGTILDVNQAMCTMYGYRHEEACSLTVEDISHGEPPYTQKEALAWMKRATEGEPQLFEWLGKHRDGHVFWTEVSMRRAEIGGASRLIVLVRDISERKETEAEKQNLLVQLSQSQKMESVGRLAGGIAHDFNNLLTPIIGYSELLKRNLPADSRDINKVDNILQASDKARILTQQLLSFGRKQILEMKTLDMNDVVTSFYDILRRTIRENIDIQLHLTQDAIGVRADKNQLQQIIMNLAVNAQDAIRDRGIITIETAPATLDDEYVRQHADVTAGNYLTLVVTDTGSGIDQETLSHIFEPFFTTKGVGEGTGLGLAMVYGLVRQHNGHIGVYSEVGKGTVFKLYFPIVEEKPSESLETAPEQLLLEADGRTILLVEDNEMVRTLVYDLLVSHGFKVIMDENPKQALKMSEGQQIDLLVTDVVMPEMNGPELHQKLLKSHPGVKVLYMSGYTNNVIVHHGVLDEGINFIQKPFAVNDLARKVKAVLN